MRLFADSDKPKYLFELYIKEIQSHAYTILFCIIIGTISTYIHARAAAIFSDLIDGFNNSGPSYLLSLCSLYIILSVIGFALGTITSYKRELMIYGTVASLHTTIINNIYQEPFYECGSKIKAELLHCISKGSERITFSFLSTPIVIISAFMGSCIAIITIDVIEIKLVIAGLLPAICLITLGTISYNYIKNATSAVVKSSIERMKILNSVIDNYIAIKSSSLETEIKDRYDVLQNNYYDTLIKRNLLASTIGIIRNLASPINIMSMFSICIIGIIDGNVTAGQIMATSIFNGIILSMLTPITGLITNMKINMPELMMIEKYLRPRNNTYIITNNINSSKLFLASNIRVQYPDSQYKLICDEFKIPESGLVTMKGDNGSGKSTFLRACALLLPPFEGHMNFKTNDNIDEKLWRTKIIYLTPDILVYTEQSIKRTFAQLYKTGDIMSEMSTKLRTRIDSIYNSLYDEITENYIATGSTLSRGQQSLATIIKMIGSEAQIALLDEVDVSLDQETKTIFCRIQDWWASTGKTSVIVSHSDISSILKQYRSIDMEYEINNVGSNTWHLDLVN